MAYSVEILDSSRNFKAHVRNLVPLDKEGNFLSYSQRLSDYGDCRFRVGTKDPLLTSEGDILKPFQNHVRIKRAGVTVWQGIIVNNPHRTKNFIEVQAYTYLYLLSTILVQHDSETIAGDGKDQYRTLSSGTLSSAITSMLNQAKTNAGTVSPLSALTLGTITNPNFPANYVTTTGAALTGAWTFSTNFTLQFSYQDMLYVISQLALYSECDFEVTNSLVFNYQTYIGNKQTNLVFEYSNRGSIEDYDVPQSGEDMATEIVGIAVDNNNKIIHMHLPDSTSITTYGKIQGVGVYPDIKNTNALKTRLKEELRLRAHPDEEINLVLNDKAYPLGQYGLGDTITVRINDHIISVNKPRRIVGIFVKVHTTGKETIRLVTNTPKDNQ